MYRTEEITPAKVRGTCLVHLLVCAVFDVSTDDW